MSHCHDEHASHGGHDHDDAHTHHSHDHTDDTTPALQHSLYQRIDHDGIITLNEADTGSGKLIVAKTWPDRMVLEPELVSDADAQLLMTVPCVLFIL